MRQCVKERSLRECQDIERGCIESIQVSILAPSDGPAWREWTARPGNMENPREENIPGRSDKSFVEEENVSLKYKYLQHYGPSFQVFSNSTLENRCLLFHLARQQQCFSELRGDCVHAIRSSVSNKLHTNTALHYYQGRDTSGNIAVMQF